MVKVVEKKMYTTKNDLPELTRSQIIDLLNNRLADCFDLYSQTKQAHWNVKGPNFIALHKLFDEVAAAVIEHVDLIAERITQLGGIAEGTVRMAAKQSSLSEYPSNIISGKEHVDALSTALATFGESVREAIDKTASLQDIATSDIFTEISRSIDKYLWFVEAHLQANS